VEEIVIERRRVFQYISLFLFLVFVYAVALSRYLDFVSLDGKVGGPVINTPLDLYRPLFGLAILSALPISVLAYFDKNWPSGAAAPLCLAAWAVVGAVFMCRQHTNCVWLVAFPFLPFIAAAAAAHAAGRATRFLLEKLR